MQSGYLESIWSWWTSLLLFVGRAAFNLDLILSHCWQIHSWDMYMIACVLDVFPFWLLAGKSKLLLTFCELSKIILTTPSKGLFSVDSLDIFIDWCSAKICLCISFFLSLPKNSLPYFSELCLFNSMRPLGSSWTPLTLCSGLKALYSYKLVYA